MPHRAEDQDQRCDYAEVFVSLIEEAFRERNKAKEKALADQESLGVCGALLARQVTLAKHLAYAPDFWTVHVAPLIFRCMTDININLAWISQDARLRSNQFVEYGLAHAGLSLKHRHARKAREGTAIGDSEYIDLVKSWISTQQVEQCKAPIWGSWSGKTAREMARESGIEAVYQFEYLPMTRFSHVDWVSIVTLNPYSIEGYDPKSGYERDQTLDDLVPPNEIYMATKMIIHAFDHFDKAVGYLSNNTRDLKRFRDHVKPMESSRIKESFCNSFIVQPDSGIGAREFQDELRRSLSVILGSAI